MTGALERLLRGEIPLLVQAVDGRLASTFEPPPALLCGSFNPVHAGHWHLAETASKRLKVPVAFEMGVVNADKPTLSLDELRRRLSQFVWRAEVWLTREPTFLGKAALFPGCTFVVGWDTAARVIKKRYYGGNDAALREALTALRDRQCRFLVAGRVADTGDFRSAGDIGVAEFADLFQGMSESEFRVDLSSTALRQHRGADAFHR